MRLRRAGPGADPAQAGDVVSSTLAVEQVNKGAALVSSFTKQGMQVPMAADGVEANGSGRSLAGMKQERRHGN